MPPHVLVLGTPDERHSCAARLRRSYHNVSAGLWHRLDAAVPVDVDVIVLAFSQSSSIVDVLIRRLRQDERTRDLPIILLADLADGEDEEPSERDGADRVLPKHWPMEVLAYEIRRVIAARRRRMFQGAANTS